MTPSDDTSTPEEIPLPPIEEVGSSMPLRRPRLLRFPSRKKQQSVVGLIVFWRANTVPSILTI